MKKLGIIQPGRIGDILICLPIALYYSKEGYSIVWPIDNRHLSMFRAAAPWVHWIPVTGSVSHVLVGAAKNICNSQHIKYIALNSTAGIRDIPPRHHTIVRFDELKYIKASVPFEWKWRLKSCLDLKSITTKTLFDKYDLDGEKYVLTHLDGSTWRSDNPNIWQNWFHIKIKPVTSSIFDWLYIIQNAHKICCVDSCFANLIEGLQIETEKIFILRSDRWLTPTLKTGWTIWDKAGKAVLQPKMMYHGNS